MNQYKNQFGTTRIADSPADRLITTWPATAKHIIVLTRDHIFKVQVVGEGGVRVPIKAIEEYVRKFFIECSKGIMLNILIDLAS